MPSAREISYYRGFYDTVNAHYCLNPCGMRKHKVDLDVDVLGNLNRIENENAKFSARLEATKTRRAETIVESFT